MKWSKRAAAAILAGVMAVSMMPQVWAALEVFAEDFCRNDCGLGFLHWPTFWDYAKRGAFYFVKEKKC